MLDTRFHIILYILHDYLNRTISYCYHNSSPSNYKYFRPTIIRNRSFECLNNIEWH